MFLALARLPHLYLEDAAVEFQATAPDEAGRRIDVEWVVGGGVDGNQCQLTKEPGLLSYFFKDLFSPFFSVFDFYKKFLVLLPVHDGEVRQASHGVRIAEVALFNGRQARQFTKHFFNAGVYDPIPGILKNCLNNSFGHFLFNSAGEIHAKAPFFLY